MTETGRFTDMDDADMRRVDVVLEIEELEGGGYRVHMIGVFDPDQARLPHLRYQHRNVVQTWLNHDHDVSAFRI